MRCNADGRRVAVTGIGLVTPLGIGAETTWKAIERGVSGIDRITHFDASALTVRIAGEVPDFAPERYMHPRAADRMDRFTQYAVAAAREALEDSGVPLGSGTDSEGAATILGVGFCGLATLEQNFRRFLHRGLDAVSPLAMPKTLPNLAPAQLTMQFGLRGVSYSVSTACASGAHAIGEAARRIRSGAETLAITGGTEACVTELGVGAFCAMRALSTCNDEPVKASRPFDAGRDGFVIAEGAAILVLEELEHARSRGARIHAELVGFAANSDGHHVTAPRPDGSGAASCMRAALDDAGLGPDQVDYINAHGTSTLANDASETRAIRTVMGPHADRVPVSSTKSMTGHMLGAAGAAEAAFSVLALERGVVPPTINHETPDPRCDLDYVPNCARGVPDLRIVLSNAFGFGGQNACLVFRRWEGAAA